MAFSPHELAPLVLPRWLDLLANNYREGVELLMSLTIGAKRPAERRAAGHRSTAQNPAGMVLGDLQACDAFDVMSRISLVEVPALVVCGEEDQLTPPKYSRFLGQRIAGARVVVAEQAPMYRWRSLARRRLRLASFLSGWGV